MNKLLVHVRAPVLTLSGYGVHSRQIMDFLLSDSRFEVFLESINWGGCAYIHNDPRLNEYYKCILKFQRAKEQNTKFDLSIHVSIPNEFQRTSQFNIGVTAGIEVDRITRKWVEKCNEMDLIIVPSKFSKNVLTGTVYEWMNPQNGQRGEFRIIKPVEIIPEWFEELLEVPNLNLSFDTEINFLHVGQWGNKGTFGEDRKNIADLIRLFYSTFKDNSKIGLVLKANIINNSEEDFFHIQKRLTEIKSNFKDAKCKLYLIHDTLTPEQMWSLYKHPQIKAFVSLTHGEGYGLPLLEAAAAGLPVIATDWSGHVDFLRKKHGYIPLEYDLVEIPECQVWDEVIDKGSRWAKVRDENVIKRLRKFADSPTLIIKEARKNIEWLNKNFSKKVILNKWKEFFDKLISVEEPSSNSKKVNTYLLQKQKAVKALEKDLPKVDQKEKAVYIMPRSAGDVLISTAIVDSLIVNRHPKNQCAFFFVTSEQYKELTQKLVEDHNIHVLSFDDRFMNQELLSEIFDYVYSPGINVQYNFSNWLLGNGEYSVRLLEEFAKNCNLTPREITKYKFPISMDFDIVNDPYIVFSPGGTKPAKTYKYWDDVLKNLKEALPEVVFVQVGTKDEKLYDDCLDYRGLNFSQTLGLLSKAVMCLSVDTFTAHAAAATETPHVVLYGSTSPHTVTPILLGNNRLQILIETPDRHGCKNPCYKDNCYNLKDGRNCISEIDPEAVYNTVLMMVEKLNEQEEKNVKN